MSELLNITIDGVKCTCEAGEYLYDVARRHGIRIPVLCRSDAFSDHRACCRVCIVEVVTKGRSKVVTSCVYPVEQECEVFTNNERIQEERAVILALLAHRAPQAKLIERMNRRMGASGFERMVSLDAEKCILCGLCTQACESLGSGAIASVERGVDKRIATPYDDPSSACIGCLSCANVCPTGAIEFEQTPMVRSIWHKDFGLVACKRCGAVLGTPEELEHAARKTGAEPASICDECRKKSLADDMMRTYRSV